MPIVRAGYPRYVKEETITLIEDIIVPNLEKEKEREVKFSEALHEAAIFYKNKRGFKDIQNTHINS